MDLLAGSFSASGDGGERSELPEGILLPLPESGFEVPDQHAFNMKSRKHF